MLLLEAVIFISLWAFGLGQLKLEQPEISITRARSESVQIPCKVSSSTFSGDYIHWYWQKPDQSIEPLLYVVSTTKIGGKNNRFEASKDFHSSTSTLRIRFLEKEDEAVYFCACWTGTHDRKVFGDGTKLIVTERSYGSEFYPKPTIFRPSAAEISLHKAGTHLCLLEKFFPDVIKVYWKEEDGDTILESQQGNTTKVGDSYMKFSWLTVSEESMHKEHRCIVKHEHNKVDQEIIFPAIKKVTRDDYHEGEKVPLPEIAVINHKIEVYLEDKSDIFQLQLINTSAYYTYLLLLLKSLVYLVVISVCLVRRTAVCDHGKSS